MALSKRKEKAVASALNTMLVSRGMMEGKSGNDLVLWMASYNQALDELEAALGATGELAGRFKKMGEAPYTFKDYKGSQSKN